MSSESKHGRLLVNRYQLVELIGSGAMGQVYRAQDKLLGGVTVAVKFLSQALLNTRARERFEQEATISALLGQQSIHIVGVRDYGVDERDIPFYVMEFLQGESLSEMVSFRPLSLSRFLHLTRQICFGLESAHRGILFQGEVCSIIHRDIKPGNIFVVQDAAFGELVKILDFGIAKPMLSGEDKTQSFVGTLAYCSPEQIEGRELDSRSDIYSLGVVMYEILTGEMPIMPENVSFGGWYEAHHQDTPKPFKSALKVPPDLAELIFHCLEKNPEARPPTVGIILQKLTELEILLKLPASSPSTQAPPLPVTKAKSALNKKPLPLEKLGKQSNWPADKPRQKIVFPQILQAAEGTFASLWIMLEKESILQYGSSIRHNQFLFMQAPHPMLLWLCVLYHRQMEPRWLPCYLDLKTDTGQQLVRLLAERGRYWLLFFAMENPRCQKMASLAVSPKQQKALLEWADASQKLARNKPQVTKKLLKRELLKLKPQILAKLQANPSRGSQ
jgi:serine/threonine-protein kinase